MKKLVMFYWTKWVRELIPKNAVEMSLMYRDKALLPFPIAKTLEQIPQKPIVACFMSVAVILFMDSFISFHW